METAKQRRPDFFIMIGMTRDSNQRRLPTLDTLRGISITMVLYLHLAGAWRAPDWATFLRLQWLALEFIGPAMFIAISMIGSMISQQASNPGQPSKLFPRRLLLRASFLFIVGECINVLVSGRLGIFHVTSWNVVTTIALFTLLLPLITRIPRALRICLAVIIILCYYPLLNWSIAGLSPAEINLWTIPIESLLSTRTMVYWLLFFHDMMAPVFSWLVVPLLVPVIFEPISRKLAAPDGTSIGRELKRIAIAGLVLFISGFVSGIQVMPDYVGRFNIELATPDAYIHWPFDGIFIFWIQSTPQYILYNLGIACIAFAALATMQVVKRKVLPGQRWIDNFGRMSLTVFCASFLLSQIDLKLPLPLFYLVEVPLIIACIGGFMAWNKKARGIGSIEWMMDVHVHAIGFFLDKRRNKSKSH